MHSRCANLIVLRLRLASGAELSMRVEEGVAGGNYAINGPSLAEKLGE
jgi:hypothetical protein